MLLKGQKMPHLYLCIPVPLTAVFCFPYSSSRMLPIQYDHSTRSSQSEELNLGLFDDQMTYFTVGRAWKGPGLGPNPW